jgi:hypothetical protein
VRIVAAVVGATACVAVVSRCGLTALPPTLTPDQRACVAASRLIDVTVGVERYHYPVYSDRLAVALHGTHLFGRVDPLERFDTPPTLVARVDRPIYGTATIAPMVTALSLGIIPTTVTEQYGYAFSLASVERPHRRIAVEFTYANTSTLGWWGLVVNHWERGTLRDVYRHPQVHQALALHLINMEPRPCKYSEICGAFHHDLASGRLAGLQTNCSIARAAAP